MTNKEKREIYLKGFFDGSKSHGFEIRKLVAATLEMFPVEAHENKVRKLKDSAGQWWKYANNCLWFGSGFQGHIISWNPVDGHSIYITPERVKIWSDLIENPYEGESEEDKLIDMVLKLLTEK